MTTYAFETITPAQALALQASDIVTFAGGPARGVSVAYNIPAVGPATVTVTYEGRSVEFGQALLEVSELRGLHFRDDSRLMVGSAERDFLVGWVQDDALFGGEGGDRMLGQGGNDYLHGNQGDDRLQTDRGADTVLGGQGDDAIRTGTGGDGEAGDYAHGNMGSDTIDGGAGNDILLGGRDNDQVTGGAGADYLSGDLGDDVLKGGAGDDTQFGADGNDSLYSNGGKDLISGGEGADVIIVSGLGGATVDGDEGDDTLLAASPGMDALLGGAGADVFEVIASVRPAQGQDDEIRDWGAADRLHFDHVGPAFVSPDQYAETTASDYANALAQANALMAGGVVRYVAAQVGGDVVVFAETDGQLANGADVAVVLGGRTLTHIEASDFI